jgi:hypothetical protein
MIHLVVGHGHAYSKSLQPVTSVPKNKTIIITTKIGNVVTYEEVDRVTKKYFHTEQGVKQFLKEAKLKNNDYRVLKQGDQFIDTLLEFYDKNVWTGTKELPDKELKNGIMKHVADMSVSPKRSPPRKRMSSFLYENPSKKEIFIFFSCRTVKRSISSAIKKNTRKAPKRKKEYTPSPRITKKKSPQSKKQKLSPWTKFSSSLKNLKFTIGRK